jgi:uncharacterized protein (TIGR00290 family)
MPAPDAPFFTSWSGGKDCCLALHLAAESGARPAALVTLMIESGVRTRSHGLARSVVQAQADALGLPLHTAPASWAGYEAAFTALIAALAARSIRDGVFGDIDLLDHKLWEQRVCANAGCAAHLPLWRIDRASLLASMFERGFEARVVAVRDGVLDRRFLGRVLTPELVAEFSALGIDACGENGEYHTVVTRAPLFRRPVMLQPGPVVLRDGVWFMDFSVG